MQGGTNVALGKRATQSSTRHSFYPASNAVDGVWQANQLSYWREKGENRDFHTIFSHTQEEKNPWLCVDFGGTFEIETVVVFNRDTSSERLFPARVFLLPEGSHSEKCLRPYKARPNDILDLLEIESVGSQRLTEDMQGKDTIVPHRIFCPTLKGRARYVVIVLEKYGFLHIAQIEAWVAGAPIQVKGTPVDPRTLRAYRRIRKLGIDIKHCDVNNLLVKYGDDIGKIINTILKRQAKGLPIEDKEVELNLDSSFKAVNRRKGDPLFSNLVNVALHKPCWQSSCWDRKRHPASKCVDGIWQTGLRRHRHQARAHEGGIKGVAANVGLVFGIGFGLGHDTSFNHTQSELNAWVVVDLGKTYDIEAICIFNRTGLIERGRLYPSVAMLLPEGSAGFNVIDRAKARSVDEVIKLLVPSENSGTSGRSGTVPNLLDRVKEVATSYQRLTIDMEGADGEIEHRVVCKSVCGPGRYVVIMLEENNYLHLAQIEAWARVDCEKAATPIEAAHKHITKIKSQGRTREEIRQSVAAEYATRKAHRKTRSNKGSTPGQASQEVLASAERTQKAVSERSEALDNLGSRASSLRANIQEYLEAARGLNKSS